MEKSLVLSKETYSLPTFLRKIYEFSLAGSGIDVNFSFDPQVNRLIWDRNLLSIAPHNIIINARQAMQDRGILKITTNLKAPYVEICIIDSGLGIPPEIKEQLFTLFVTIKPGESGLGVFSAKKNYRRPTGEKFSSKVHRAREPKFPSSYPMKQRKSLIQKNLSCLL